MQFPDLHCHVTYHTNTWLIFIQQTGQSLHDNKTYKHVINIVGSIQRCPLAEVAEVEQVLVFP